VRPLLKIINVSVFLLLSLNPDFARSQQEQPGFEDPIRKTVSDEQTEQFALENYARGVVLYYKNQGTWAREEADLTWKKVAEIAVRPEMPLLNYVILQAALNTGKFEVARKALIALGEREANSIDLETKNLESMAFKTKDSEWIVSIADLLDNGVAMNTGSGTIVSKDGWILTAAHVIAQTPNPVVVLQDGKISKVELLHPGDFKNDMVLVKVNQTFLSSAQIAKVEPISGDSVHSIGFPAGCNVPVKSKGLVQANVETKGLKSVATTLSTLPGSSGSGVFNGDGQIAGVVKEFIVTSAEKKKEVFETTTWLTPLADIRELVESLNKRNFYPLKEREKWTEKSELWSNNLSGESLFRRALTVFYSDPVKAKELLEEAYEEGDMMAATYLGSLLLSKPGKSQEDDKIAYQYFLEASETIPFALAFVGAAKIEGLGTDKDVSKGIEELKVASERGATSAAATMGTFYLYGIGMEKNEKEAVKWLTKGATDGNPEAQYYLGVCYFDGLGVAKNQVEAVRWLKEAAKQGHVVAQDRVASCYYKGTGVTKDEKEEVFWRSKAAEQGDAMAQNALGIAYADGSGVVKNEKKAFELYKKSADQGFAQGQYSLGNCFFYGSGVAKNEKKGIHWYTKAAEQGVPEAQYMLGTIYSSGTAISKDEKEAAKWFIKAAEQGDVMAQAILGIWYKQGIGVQVDEKESLKWITKAAEQGNVDAQCLLGAAFFEGNGVTKNFQEALKWFKASAEKGHAPSQKTLGIIYYEGSGAPKDLKKAVYYLEMAKTNGDADVDSYILAAKAELEKTK